MADGDTLPATLPSEPPKYADIELTPTQLEEARAEYPELSDKARIHRKKLSVLAKLKHQYVDPATGRAAFGGPQPNSGRRATKRIGEAIVEAAQSRHKEVVDAVFAPIDANSGADPMQRHKAGMNIAKHEREERLLDMAEDEFARKTEDEVRNDAATLLAKLVMSGKLSMDDIKKGQEKPIDVESEDITDAEQVA